MAGYLPFVEFLNLFIAIILALITILTFYRYLSLDRRLSDLVMSIGFLLLTVYAIEITLAVLLGTAIFYELNLGGIGFFIFLLGFIVLLIGIIVQVRGGE